MTTAESEIAKYRARVDDPVVDVTAAPLVAHVASEIRENPEAAAVRMVVLDRKLAELTEAVRNLSYWSVR